MIMLDYFISRTEQKLRFARIHLDELRAHPSRNTGDDFERSHHESFLFHLYGASDAFLQELNIYYSCGQTVNQVSRQTLKENLKKRGLTSNELVELEEIEADADSFLGIAKELRHHGTHRGGIPMQHYFNGPSNLVHPTTRKEFQTDTIELLSGWQERLTKLLERFRANVPKPDRKS